MWKEHRVYKRVVIVNGRKVVRRTIYFLLRKWDKGKKVTVQWLGR